MRKGFACPSCGLYQRGMVYAREPVYGLMMARCPGCGVAGVLPEHPAGSVVGAVARSPAAVRKLVMGLVRVLVLLPLMTVAMFPIVESWWNGLGPNEGKWSLRRTLLDPIGGLVAPSVEAVTSNTQSTMPFIILLIVATAQGTVWGVQASHLRPAVATQLGVPMALVLMLMIMTEFGSARVLTDEGEEFMVQYVHLLMFLILGGVLAIAPTVSIRRRGLRRGRVRARLRKMLQTQRESA